MPEINLVDQALKEDISSKELSIQVSMNGFSFSIHTVPDNTIKAFRSYAFPNTILQEEWHDKITEILEHDEYLKLPYQKVRITLITRKSTILPEEYFKPEILKSILDFNQPMDEYDEIQYNTIGFCNSKLIFAIPSYVAGIFSRHFEKITFCNQATSLLLFSHELSKHELFTIFINLNNDFFDLAIFKEGNLKLYNSFLYVNSTDLIYFILYACKQLTIDLQKSGFYFSGEKSNDKQLTDEVQRYIKNYKNISELPSVHFSNTTRSAEINRFATLFNLLMCE